MQKNHLDENVPVLPDSSAPPASDGGTSNQNNQNGSNMSPSAVGPVTLPKLIADITIEYIDEQLKIGPPYNPKMWEGQAVNRVAGAIATLNPMRPKGQKFPAFYKLTPWQIAKMMMAIYEIRRISLMDSAKQSSSGFTDLIGVYQSDTGLYEIDPVALRAYARQFNSQLTERDMKEVRNALEEEAKVCQVEHNPNLVPMKNGIFNYETKQLMEYSPDYVFLSKSSTDYVEDAPLPVIHNDEDDTDWDPESWMDTLSDDPEIVNLLWEVTGATLRPNVPWNKLILLYSRVGCNGKGTLCSLWRELIGMNVCATLQLDEIDKEFALEALIRAQVIIADENPVGIFLDKISKLKAIVTGDRVTITRKFEKAVEMNFRGAVIECVNELPNFKDRTNSMYRRQLIIPFDKSFEHCERKYIKEDYLKREDVKEYIAWRVLNMEYTSLSEPEACKEALEEFKIWNDPIREFVEDALHQLTWNAFTPKFAYALYLAWFDKNNPSGKKVSFKAFNQALSGILAEGSEWEYKKSLRVANHTKAAEPLLLEYDLREYQNPNYFGADATRKAMFDFGDKVYRGYQRFAVSEVEGEGDSEEPDGEDTKES